MNKIITSILNSIAGLLIISCLLLGSLQVSAQQKQITGLDDWTLFIDPGHSQKENMGLYNYSEAEKVLRVAWHLRDMLEEQTDIKQVFMARETDEDNIGLTARVDLANTLGADFYYSIHSDAGSPSVNSTLMLYGGWKSNGTLVEKSPEGGAAYGEILDWDLTGAMRIDRRGNFADRVFYQGNVYHHDNQWSFLAVNRISAMASLLSEAGFHTNPGQQMLNLNAEWKVLEALSAFRSFLEWHDIDRPEIGVATGVITDLETGLALNDVTVTIGDEVYVTDGWNSLFNGHSNNPDQLRNGFYYIDGLTPGSTVEVSFEKEGYETLVTDLEIVSNPNGLTEDNLSFLDPKMISLVPPVVKEVRPADELDNLIPGTALIIQFSRQMDQQSVADAFSIEPSASYELSWVNAFTLSVNTSQFDFLETYTITLDGSIAKNTLTEQLLDGNGDGTEGGDFVLEITMSDEDTDPPALLDYSPVSEMPAQTLRPQIRLVYDEEIIETSIGTQPISVSALGETDPVAGEFHHLVVNNQSVLHFFPTEDLTPGVAYTVTIAAGLSDMFDNATKEKQFNFYITEQLISSATVIDDFNAGVTSWWNPQQAGQTAGVVTELTSRTANGDVVNKSLASTGSMKLSYAWDPDFTGTPYIRQHIPSTAPQNQRRFNIDDILQVFVYGDGSHNQFRMMIRDGANQLETHAWVTIDWMGWKLVKWDLANDETFPWAGVSGDGNLDGANFYMDGFHLRHAEGGAGEGAIYFDHLHFVRRTEMDYPSTLSENWQLYDDFTTDILPWRNVDVKGVETYHPAGFTFSGSGEAYAFKVLNPAETEPAVINNHPPVVGDKYLIAMQSKEEDEDKWLISQQLRATELSQLSFYARSIEVGTYGPERFRVWISMDDKETFEFDPDDFTMISQGDYLEAPEEWTEYSYYLGDMAGEVYRFAIQYVSHDDYMLMLDKIEVGSVNTYQLSLGASPEYGGEVAGDGEYGEEQLVEVTATAAAGYNFINWTDADGEELSTDATYEFRMPGNDLSLTAHFAAAEYNVTLNVEPEGAGTVTGAGAYVFGVEVTAVATPAEGFAFVYWADRDGNEVDAAQTYVFEMPPHNVQLIATFQDATSVSDLPSEHIAVFPNPSRGHLTIRSQGVVKAVALTDLAGREVLRQNAEGKEFHLSLSGMEPGLYVLRVYSESGVYVDKIQLVK